MSVPSNLRLLPPVDKSRQILNVNGRNYSAAPGQTVTAIQPDAMVLLANGWVGGWTSGTSVQRPNYSGMVGEDGIINTGMLYLDTTLGYLIVWDGVFWRNPSTGAVV